MRVLVVCWEYPPVIEGGLARHVGKLSEQLAALGVEVHVLTRGGDRLSAREQRHAVTVHRLREPAFPRDVPAFLNWVEAMNAHIAQRGDALAAEIGFDLVHSHDWLVADGARHVARRAGVPWLVTVHATEYGRHQGWVGEEPQSQIHAAEREMVHAADHVITCSRYMREHLTQVFGLSARHITAIPNGVDPSDLEPVAADLPALRARFADPHERLVLLVGRLVHEKGFHLALEALAPLIARGLGVRFVVAGTGSAEAGLRRQARRLGIDRHGTFLGWVGDDMLHALYRIAEVCIVPSIYEPFGIVALEAMASGCPCVVADTGGLREVIPGDGTVGLRFPSRDSDALGETLGAVLNDEARRARLAAQAREHVLSFDWASVAQRTAALYAQLVGQAEPLARRP